ncbi:hypothetical protein BaRGS_00018241 [Batillaria attramentaria]|uniref:Uncharacterized protein n=1 Tax=Batillaria attramentaria TaxID=370345 RepID=A0ABD0KTF2_9CAEN
MQMITKYTAGMQGYLYKVPPSVHVVILNMIGIPDGPYYINIIILIANGEEECPIKLRSSDVSATISLAFHATTISSVLTCGIVGWGGNSMAQEKGRADEIMKKSSGVIGRQQASFDSQTTDRQNGQHTE